MAVNYNEPDKLLDQMSSALKKFFGAQGTSAKFCDSSSSISIKPEPVFATEDVNIMNRNKRFEPSQGRYNYGGSSNRGNEQRNHPDAKGNINKFCS